MLYGIGFVFFRIRYQLLDEPRKEILNGLCGPRKPLEAIRERTFPQTVNNNRDPEMLFT